MNGPINATTPPDLRSLLDGFKQEVLQSLNCHLVGTVVDVQDEPEFVQRVSVQIASKKILPDGSAVDYPILTDCPLFVLGGGKAFVFMPVAVGDPCLVLFHDTDLDNWWKTGDISAPNTARTHSLSDGLVMVGFHNLANPVPLFSSAAYFVHGPGSVSIDPTGVVTLNGPGGYIQMLVNGDIKINSLAGASIELTAGGLISVANGSGSLKTALDLLFTTLSSWVNTGGSTPNPATLTAIAAAKNAVDSILT